ncbi:putative Beta-hexosaminidase-like, domain 2 [Helianthus debilis subsp. tardiflorus]
MTVYVAIALNAVILLFTATHSSIVGVEYVSRLLQVQYRERAPSSVQLSAARAVLDRFIPSHSSSFQFNIITKVKVPVIVSGCKLDLRDKQQAVSLELVMSPIMQQFREIETCIECSTYKHIQGFD